MTYLILDIINSYCVLDDNDKKNNQDVYRTEKITKPQKKFGRNPFIDDSSDSENDETNFEDKVQNINVEVNEVPSGKILGPRGVWREVFFFKIDDSRFKGNNLLTYCNIVKRVYYIIILDAEEFYDPQYNKVNYTGSQDPRFIKKRDFLREFLKNKNNRHKRDLSKKLFSKKLGGTHNNRHTHKSKPEKVLKLKKHIDVQN